MATRSIGAGFADTDGSKVSPVVERICIIGAQVKTDTVLGEVAHANEIVRRSRQIARKADDEILNGAGLTAQNDLIGLQSRCTGAQLVTQATDGAVITLAKVQELMDVVEKQGGEKLLITNKVNNRNLVSDLAENAAGVTIVDLMADLPKVEDATVVLTGKKDDKTALLPFTETCGQSSVTSSVYCVAPGNEDMMGLQIALASNSIQVIDEGIVNAQRVTTVQLAFGLAVHQTDCIARLRGCKAS